MERKLYCFSHQEFDDYCENQKFSKEGDNVPAESAFISIIGTPECQEYYLCEKEEHYFKQNSSSILNLEFDDLSKDSFTWHGHTFYGLTMEQAEQIIKFISNNRGKNFYIHCRAGQSRSQGVVRYILDTYPDMYTKKSCRSCNPCKTPNIDVVAKLKRAYRNGFVDIKEKLEDSGLVVKVFDVYPEHVSIFIEDINDYTGIHITFFIEDDTYTIHYYTKYNRFEDYGTLEEIIKKLKGEV